MRYFRLLPSRPFSLTRCSPADVAAGTAPIFTYDFDTSEPIFKLASWVFVTRSCAEALRAQGLTGFESRPIETLRSAAAQEPVEQLLFDGNGEAGRDDLGMQGGVNLIVSERARQLLEAHGMSDVETFDYDPAYRTPTVAELIAQKRRKS